MPEATIGGRIRHIFQDRLANLPSLISEVSSAPRHLADGPLLHVASSLKFRSLLSAFYLDRFFLREHKRQMVELNTWAKSRFTGKRFQGDHFILDMPDFPDAVAVAVYDLREIYLENRYAAMLPYQCLVQEGDTVIDCGGNIGAFSIYAATRAPGVKVLAFEPEPATREAFLHNVGINGLESRVECLPYGLSNRESTFQIVRRTDCFTMHRLTEAAAGETTDTVKCIPIDSCLDKLTRCDVIKMDIEGAEQSALEGAAQTLRRFRPRLTLAAYHKPNDPWVLSKTIRKIVPEYNIIVSRDAHLYAWV